MTGPKTGGRSDVAHDAEYCEPNGCLSLLLLKLRPNGRWVSFCLNGLVQFCPTSDKQRFPQFLESFPVLFG